MGFQWGFPIASPSLGGSSVSGDESPSDMVRKPSNLSNMVSPLDGGHWERAGVGVGPFEGSDYDVRSWSNQVTFLTPKHGCE